MGEFTMLLYWGMVLGIGFCAGCGIVALGGLTVIKFLAWLEIKIWGKKHAKKTTVRCSKDGANGNAGGVLPPER